MALWNIDLSTREGAQAAIRLASRVCLGFAVLLAISLFVLGGLVADFSSQLGLAVLGLTGLQLLVPLIAGIKLRRDKGLVWGIGAAFAILADLIQHVMSVEIRMTLFDLALLLLLMAGLRGIPALRRINRAEARAAAQAA